MEGPSGALRDLVTQDDGTTAIVPKTIVPKGQPALQPVWRKLATRFLCCFHNKIQPVNKHEGKNNAVQVEVHSESDAGSQDACLSELPSESEVGAQDASAHAATPSMDPSPQASLPRPLVSQAPQSLDKCPAAGLDEDKKLLAKTRKQRPVEQPRVQDLLLPPQEERFHGMKTLVLDLDETLVHSSFKKVSCEMELTKLGDDCHTVYVKKRPGVDEFLRAVAEYFEIVIFTASTALYANTLLDELDSTRSISHRLYRDACSKYREGYVKDLSRLGRDLRHVIIIDNLPICYALQPQNAIPIATWRDDPDDTELIDLLPILVALSNVESVPDLLTRILYEDE